MTCIVQWTKNVSNTYSAAAPLAAVAGEALGGPAGAAAGGALAVGGQVALAPVMHMTRFAARAICRILLAVGCREVYAFSVYVVLAYWTKEDSLVNLQLTWVTYHS